eukprot:m.245842 g.245842  ORF g.245842 m.245842 type:complete len:257 (+) comp16109_c4_seq1:112-882(+)
MEGDTALLLVLATWADAGSWSFIHYCIWTAAIFTGYEILSTLVIKVPPLFNPKTIPVRGRHLDSLAAKDLGFIAFNRIITVVFVYHLLWYCHGIGATSGQVKWDISELSILNTIVAFPALFIVYDFFYHAFHFTLHYRTLYAYVHKHHHQQMAPSRGNTDAINVHPFEFVTGEYLHLLAVILVPCHFITALCFIVVGGTLASLNHTRYDLQIPFALYKVKYHDEHHVVPNTNYSQYTVFWDKVWGTFKEYPNEKSS